MKRKALDDDDKEETETKQTSPKRIKKRLYVALDLETTGTDPKQDEIIQIALVKFNFDDGSIVEEWESLVKPSKSIPQEAQAVHNFSDEDVADAPKFADLADKICTFIGEAGLVGHNLLQFDLPLLQTELRKAKHAELDCRERSLLDTLVIYQKKEPHTLSKAASFYCDVEYFDAHNARDDAVACMKVCIAQKEKYKELFEDMTKVERLCKPYEFFEEEFDSSQKLTDLLIRFGKHKGKRATEIRRTDRGYWNWLLNKEKQSRSKWYAKLQSLPM